MSPGSTSTETIGFQTGRSRRGSCPRFLVGTSESNYKRHVGFLQRHLCLLLSIPVVCLLSYFLPHFLCCLPVPALARQLFNCPSCSLPSSLPSSFRACPSFLVPLFSLLLLLPFFFLSFLLLLLLLFFFPAVLLCCLLQRLSPKAGKMPCWNHASALCFILSFQAVHSPILVKAFLVSLPQPLHHPHRDRHLAWWHRLEICSLPCSNCPCAACILGDKYARIVADSKEWQHSASPNQHIAVEKLVYWQTIMLSCKK